MFELLDDYIKKRNPIEPRPWHAWEAAAWTLLVLASLAEFAFRRADWLTSGSIGAYAFLVFMCADGVIAVVAWARSLAGQIRAYRVSFIGMACFFSFSLVRSLLR